MQADAPIVLEPYNPEWPFMFESERRLLVDVLAPWLAGPIEHIAAEYVRLKRRLAALHANDRERYTDEKSGFIESVLKRP